MCNPSEGQSEWERQQDTGESTHFGGSLKNRGVETLVNDTS